MFYKKNNNSKKNKNKNKPQNKKQTKSLRRNIKKTNTKRGGGCYDTIEPIQQWNSAYEKAPPHDLNGGIYSGEQAKGPWGHIPVIPTTTNYIYNNLKSAEPPPGALTSYPGTDRMGNNYQAMPGIQPYTNSNYGPFKANCSLSVMNGGKTNINSKKSIKKRMSTIF